MTEYKVITLPLTEEDIADQTDYIAFEYRLKPPNTVNSKKFCKKCQKIKKYLKKSIIVIHYMRRKLDAGQKKAS